MTAFQTLLLLLAPAAGSQGSSIEGNWVNPSGSVTVSIAACGAAQCGTVIKASEKAQADARRGGTPQLVGTVLLSNLQPNGEGHWKGKIFVPDLNIRSRAKLEQTAADSLKVAGCGPTGLVCKAQLWTRAGP